MKTIVGDYLIESDNRQLILKSKDFTLTNVKNKETGEIKTIEVHRTLGYYSDLENLFRGIERQIIYENDECKVIAEKLSELNKSMKELSELLKKVIE